MKTEITYYRKSVYGNEHIYAADETQAHCLALLTGQKTLTESSLNALAGLGFSLTEILPPRKKSLNFNH